MTKAKPSSMNVINPENCPEILNPDHLSGGALFGAISPGAVSFLINNGRILKFGKGEQVFNYGDRGESFYIVLDGSLSFYKFHSNTLLHTRDIGFGEETGFVSMIALHDHVGHATANETSLVLEINSELFARLQTEFPADFGIITLNLARDMARVIRKLSNALVEHSIRYEL